MIEVKDRQDAMSRYTEQFGKLEHDAAKSPGWLLPIRKGAIARFAEVGFPTTRDEDWRFTNVSPIAKLDVGAVDSKAAKLTADDIAPFVYDDLGGPVMVFVNGRFSAALSSVGSLPEGVRLSSLAGALSSGAAVVEACLARGANYQKQAFVALNTALFEDGAFIHVSKGSVVGAPIQILYVTTAGEKPVAIHPRTLVVADESSEVRVVESFAGIGTGAYFVNPVTEVFIGSNATVDFGRVEHEGAGGMHVGTIQFCQERDSNVLCHIVTLDGRLVRHDVNALLDGEGCDCSLNGFYVVEGSRHVDNHLWVDHAKPHCDSREFFKGVLAEHGRGVFSGKIIVREHAQKTDAKQTNQSLLLSPDAQVESKPQLEIFADDVKCTHGATVGQVSEESMFYLRSRGLDAQAARNMLVYAFAAEALESLRIGPLKARLEAELFARLPKISAESQAGS